MMLIIVGDSFTKQHWSTFAKALDGAKFTTKDRDQDSSDSVNCAIKYVGAWWYTNCHGSNLNGHYANPSRGSGIHWFSWKGYSESLKTTEMKIRSKY